MPTRADASGLPVRVRSMTVEAEDVLSVELEAIAEALPAWESGPLRARNAEASGRRAPA